MNHSRAQGLLSAYLEDDLSHPERSAVEVHLAGCEGCSEDLRDLRDAVAMLRRLPAPEPPPFLASRVMARIAAGEAQPRTWRRWLAQAGAPLVAAPLAAAAAALAVFALAGSPGPGGEKLVVASTRIPPRPLVNVFTGPAVQVAVSSPEALAAARPPAVFASVVRPDRLRGANHPNSAELARYFAGPTESVVWTPR